MMIAHRTTRLLFAAVLLVHGAAAIAGETCAKCRPAVDLKKRAGYPQCISKLAWPAQSARECGYWVGGGAPHRGQGRYADEGTWGWDYNGILFPKKVALGWWHGRREQGGSGAYKTDGPKLHLKH